MTSALHVPTSFRTSFTFSEQLGQVATHSPCFKSSYAEWHRSKHYHVKRKLVPTRTRVREAVLLRKEGQLAQRQFFVDYKNGHGGKEERASRRRKMREQQSSWLDPNGGRKWNNRRRRSCAIGLGNESKPSVSAPTPSPVAGAWRWKSSDSIHCIQSIPSIFRFWILFFRKVVCFGIESPLVGFPRFGRDGATPWQLPGMEPSSMTIISS